MQHKVFKFKRLLLVLLNVMTTALEQWCETYEKLKWNWLPFVFWNLNLKVKVTYMEL